MGRREEELNAVADVLDLLAGRIRSLTVNETTNNPRKPSDSFDRARANRHDFANDDESRGMLEVGDHVRVTIAGPYRHRTGIIVSRRGACFWNIRLDPRDGEIEKVIFKKTTSLRRIT